MRKIAYKLIGWLIVFICIIFSTSLLGGGTFWGIKIAFGYGGGGGGGDLPPPININTNLNLPPPPVVPVITVNNLPNTTSALSISISGTRSAGLAVLINNSSANTKYPSATTWTASQSLILGINSFAILGQDTLGNSSTVITVLITRTYSADVTGDGITDDLDLAMLVSNWGKSYAQADFNNDGIIDDLDLAYLVSNWSF